MSDHAVVEQTGEQATDGGFAHFSAAPDAVIEAMDVRDLISTEDLGDVRDVQVVAQSDDLVAFALGLEAQILAKPVPGAVSTIAPTIPITRVVPTLQFVEGDPEVPGAAPAGPPATIVPGTEAWRNFYAYGVIVRRGQENAKKGIKASPAVNEDLNRQNNRIIEEVTAAKKTAEPKAKKR